MPYEINDRQFAAVTALDGPGRYAHFIARVADWEELWGLANRSGFVGMADDDGNECLPFWPHSRYAEAMATGEWSDCQPERIPLLDFIEEWLPGMRTNNLMAAIFPTAGMQGGVVAPELLLRDLRAECARYL